MPNQYSFNDPQAQNPLSAWITSPYVQKLIENTINPDSTSTDNLYTKGWIDSGGIWHPYASDFDAQRSIPGRVSPSFIQGPATQSYGGGPQVPIDATIGNAGYSPFSTSYAPASSSTQAYDQYGNPSATNNELPNMTFGSRYLQGTNYAPGDPNAPAGMGGRFWQTLAQNQAGWQPSPAAQDLMSKNVPQQLGNTFNLTQAPIAAQATAVPNPAPVSNQKKITQSNVSPLYQNQRYSQPYVGSAAWSAMRGMR